MNIHNHKRAMTLAEVMICTVILSIMTVALISFSNEVSVSMNKNKARTESIMKEYDDILKVRGSEKSDVILNNQDRFTLVEETGQWQLWKYDGIYFKTSKLYLGGGGS